MQALVVQIGDRVQAEQVLEEILHAAMAEPEGGAEVVEVNGFVGVRSEKITRFSQPTVACGEAGCGWRNEIVTSAAQGSEEGFEQFALEIIDGPGPTGESPGCQIIASQLSGRVRGRVCSPGPTRMAAPRARIVSGMSGNAVARAT